MSRLAVVPFVLCIVLWASGCTTASRGGSTSVESPTSLTSVPTPTAEAYAPGPPCPEDYVATIAPADSVEQPTAPPPEPREIELLGPPSCEAQFELPASVALADPSRWTGDGQVPIRLIVHPLVGDQPFGAFRTALVARGYTLVSDDESAYRADAAASAHWTLQLDDGSTIVQAVYYPEGTGSSPRAVVISVDLDGG